MSSKMLLRLGKKWRQGRRECNPFLALVFYSVYLYSAKPQTEEWSSTYLSASASEYISAVIHIPVGDLLSPTVEASPAA